MTGIAEYFQMEEHSLLFGVLSLLFVISLILFANLCVKLEKKKQASPTENNVQSQSKRTESERVLLHQFSAMESAVQNDSALHRHLSTNSSHYTDKRYRPIPSSAERSPYVRSISSSPRSTNSSEHSASGHDINRFRVGSESQKLKRDTSYVGISHQRQMSLEVPHTTEGKQSRYAPGVSSQKPLHLPHEQLKRTEPSISLTRDNSFRSSGGSTSSSHKRNYQQQRSTASGSGTVTTGTLPIESATPKNSTSDSQSEGSKYYKLSHLKPLVPKYSDSKPKGTPVRNARVEIDPPTDFMDSSLSPSRDSSQDTDITLQSVSQNKPVLNPASEDVNNILSSQFPYSRAVKRQLSYEDSNCYPPYYRPSVDSTCQLYSTQSNKNLPLRMRFPKLSSTGTDFADDETEGTSVCQSIYSSYTSLYQTDTEEFMLGEPQVLKLSRELESPFLDVPCNEQRTPLVAQYAKHYTEDLIRNGRCHTNMSEYSDSDISFIWQGDDSGKHEYTANDAQLPNDRRNLVFPRHLNRKQGYTDYSGGLSFFSFVRKDSIPEETHTGVPIQPNGSQNRTIVSPSRFVGYPKFTKSISSNVPDEVYRRYNMENSIQNSKSSITPSSRDVSKSSENIKLPPRQSLVRDNSKSHPNLRGSKQSQSHYYDYTKKDHISLDTPPPLYPKVGPAFNRNNSNNDLDNMSGGSLTHL